MVTLKACFVKKFNTFKMKDNNKKKLPLIYFYQKQTNFFRCEEEGGEK